MVFVYVQVQCVVCGRGTFGIPPQRSHPYEQPVRKKNEIKNKSGLPKKEQNVVDS